MLSTASTAVPPFASVLTPARAAFGDALAIMPCWLNAIERRWGDGQVPLNTIRTLSTEGYGRGLRPIRFPINWWMLP